jgi:hypothetical protein
VSHTVINESYHMNHMSHVCIDRGSNLNINKRGELFSDKFPEKVNFRDYKEPNVRLEEFRI